MTYSGYSFYERNPAERKVTRVQDANSAWYAQGRPLINLCWQ
jgi:hypothetical protein